MQTRFVLAIVFAGACSTPIDTSIKLDKSTPDSGSLLGGTHIIIEGQGFRAAPNHVIIGDTEAPLASVLDDGRLEVVTPPGTMAGDAKITVFNPNGQGTATGLFRYSTAPAIMSVSPTDALYDAGTKITLTGTGFKDENAGYNRVMVDGVEAVDVMAVSDTQLTFTAPAGDPFAHPTVEVTNSRGVGEKLAAYRLIPSNNPVLLMFSVNNTGVYGATYDPMTGKVAKMTNKTAPMATVGFRAVVRDAGGTLWGIDRNFTLGKIDIENQKLTNTMPSPTTMRMNALAAVGNTIYALNGIGAYGTMDLNTGTFSQIVASGYSRASGLISDGTMLWWTQRPSLFPLTPASGAKGTAVTMSVVPSRGNIGAVLNGTLYFINPGAGGSATDTEIYKVNPTTGETTLDTTINGVKLSGVSVYQPGSSSTIQ